MTTTKRAAQRVGTVYADLQRRIPIREPEGSTLLDATAPEAAVPSSVCSTKRRLRFNGHNEFQLEVRRRVSAHLRATGRPERGGIAMYAKTAVILASFAAVYVLLVFVATAWWQALP